MEINFQPEAKQYIEQKGQAIVVYRGSITACCLSRTVGPNLAKTPPQVNLVQDIEAENLAGLDKMEIEDVVVYIQPALKEEGISGIIELNRLLFLRSLSFKQNKQDNWRDRDN